MVGFSMTNPLLHTDALPNYDLIKPEHAEDAVRTQITANRTEIERLLANPSATFDGLIKPFEALQHRLSQVFAPVSHLNAVANTDVLREAYAKCIDLLTVYQTEVGQHRGLAVAYAHILSAEEKRLSATEQRVVNNTLRDFRLAGIDLTAADRDRFGAIMQSLARAQSSFEEHVLDTTRAWSYHVTDPAQLSGLPPHILEQAHRAATAAGKPGWRFQLDQPTYIAAVTHADSREFRKVFYEAWVTRASDKGPHSPNYDNGPLLVEILKLRHETATLLGFSNYAELSLATKMATNPAEVLEFLRGMAAKYLPTARTEFETLSAFAGFALEAWDVAYYSDKLQQKEHNISEEALRPWFPLTRVLAGLFEIITKLYGVSITERSGVSVWDPTVRYFVINDFSGAEIGGLYADFYARQGKRAGAWMSEVVVRKKLLGSVTTPVANIVCNFTLPAPQASALLTHSEVVTLFHEFGHALHHLLTTVDYPTVAGINGVPWDAVELPSQLMEQWAWRAECLPLISGHVDTGEPLAEAILTDLLATRRFQAGLAAVRQLEFALFDFVVHSQPTAPLSVDSIYKLLEGVRSDVAVVPNCSFNRFAHSFMHIFSGGYAAGYYSYKWAEVLSADAFAAFVERGVFDTITAKLFLTTTLSQGGACDQMAAFVAFRGHRPDVEYLLRQDGISV